MIVDIEKLNQVNPEVKEKIKSVSELHTESIYLLELEDKIPATQIRFIADHLSETFDSLGLKCIIIPNGLLKNIYKLKGGEDNDSRTSTE